MGSSTDRIRDPRPRRSPDIRIKRAYAEPAASDGVRILVDRLWPRGLTKVESRIDEWAKDVAPTSALRRWFGHDPERWEVFSSRYRSELGERPLRLARLRAIAREGRVTLLYAARDEDHNHAIVLRDVLIGAD